jgi:2-oxoisovalerate dehydrogenase E2 component (dihydrolipoyl transacylase)
VTETVDPTAVHVFRLPDVGEGLEEAEIVSWKVEAGQVVAVNDVIVEIETAKSLVELPSPVAGTVGELLVEEGATVEVGSPIIRFHLDPGELPVDAEPTAEPGTDGEVERDADVEVDAEVDGAAPVAEAAVDPGTDPEPEPEAAQAMLVGWVPPASSIARRRRHLHARVAGSAPRENGEAVLTSPPVRKFARDLGVDLGTVRPTGPRGTVTRPDVQRAADGSADATGVVDAGAAVGPAAPRETREQIRSVRRMTAENVTASAFTAPHVTEFVEVDVTRSMKLLDRLRARRDMEGLKVSPVLLLAKAMCLAAKRTPEINASWDGPNNEIVYKHYVNLGIAAATPRGLMVPNIKDADQMAIPELCRALNELVTTARAGRTTPAQMQGGTITLTNVGVFGVDTGTPILNSGESAILAFGAINDRPWVHKGRVRPRKVTTLALSFDHRIVDGEAGSRFLADVGVIMSDPATSLLWT